MNKRTFERSDPVAILLSSLVTIGGLWHVWPKIGLTGDDATVLLGTLMTAASAIRTIINRREDKAAASVKEPDK